MVNIKQQKAFLSFPTKIPPKMWLFQSTSNATAFRKCRDEKYVCNDGLVQGKSCQEAWASDGPSDFIHCPSKPSQA